MIDQVSDSDADNFVQPPAEAETHLTEPEQYKEQLIPLGERPEPQRIGGYVGSVVVPNPDYL